MGGSKFAAHASRGRSPVKGLACSHRCPSINDQAIAYCIAPQRSLSYELLGALCVNWGRPATMLVIAERKTAVQ
jgi:hypothetical protein